jgi:hypothetical protein
MSSITVSDLFGIIRRGLRDVYFLASAFDYRRQPKKKIICYPRRPFNPLYMLAKIRWGLPVKFTSSVHEADLEVYFDDHTNSQFQEITINKNIKTINKNCKDISKSHVDNIFKVVFGYSLIVNPLEDNHLIIEKSEKNAKHDGRIIQSPIQSHSIDQSKVYQKVINNIYNDFAIDYRVVWIKDDIALTYIKYALKKNRFKSKTVYSKIVHAKKLFSHQEINLIKNFCKNFHLDFGELDILRDRQSKKIYIVDVNKTAWGPPDKIALKDGKKAIQLINKKFQESYLN